MSVNPSSPGRSIEIGAVLTRIADIYGNYIGPLLLSAVVVFLPVALIAALLAGSAGGALLVLVLSIVATLWYTGVVVRLVQDVQDGRLDANVRELFSSVTPVLLPLFGLGIVAGIAIGIGFLFFIIPGLILLTIWAVAAPVLVLERAGVFASLGRSRALVRGNGWQVFGVIVAIFAIEIVIGLVISAIGAIGDSAALRFIVQLIVNVLLAPVSALAASTIYFALRGARGEGAAAPAGFEAPVSPGTPGGAAPAPAPPTAPSGADAFGNPITAPAEPPAPAGFEPPQAPPTQPGERAGGSIPPPSTPPPS
ncbi:MAG TPA: hypothetical protein VII98_08450 [Solirubrobacteraceae bacterium]